MIILQETINHLRATNEELLQNLYIERVTIGQHLAAVKLSDGSYGISSVIENSKIHCGKKDRDFGDFTPLKIIGKSVTEVFETEKSSAVVIMLRIACLNAISSGLLSKRNYKVEIGIDPIDMVEIKPDTRVVIVGAFQSYIERCHEIGCSLKVLELNREALQKEHQDYYVPAEKYPETIPGCDVLIITGLTLVNNTLDNLLGCITQGTTTIVTGPSSSIIPDVLFKNRVDIIGGTRVVNPEQLFPLVSQGAAGYHLFKYCAEKISIRK